jgi:pyruvate dehydrogenase E2 component (dihydrolipoamide acetyltransferase)
MVRKVISSRLTEAKASVPHFYATMDCKIDGLLELRKTLKVSGMNGKACVLVGLVNRVLRCRVFSLDRRPV